MNLRITGQRLVVLCGIALLPAFVIILFFSGIFPVEELLSLPSKGLTASVAAADVAALTNEDRMSNGLAPLAVSPLLTEAAQMKADDMAAHSYYAHTGPDGKTMLDWMKLAGYRYVNAGENLVIDRTTAEQVVDAWMNSPNHRANLLRPQFTQIGIGVSEGTYQGIPTIFVVQEFGTPYPTRTELPSPTSAPRTVAASVPSRPLLLPSKIVPSSIPHVATLAPTSIRSKTPGAGSSLTASSTHTAGQGSSTISYTLAPEFYAPITLASHEKIQNMTSLTPPEGASESLFSTLFNQIKAYLSHFL